MVLYARRPRRLQQEQQQEHRPLRRSRRPFSVSSSPEQELSQSQQSSSTTNNNNSNRNSSRRHHQQQQRAPVHRQVTAIAVVVALFATAFSCCAFMWMHASSSSSCSSRRGFLSLIRNTWITTAATTATTMSSSGTATAAGAAFSSSSASTAFEAVSRHRIGLGTFLLEPSQVKSAVRSAVLDAGYRRIDCAPVYFNEHLIGDALADLLVTASGDGDGDEAAAAGSNRKIKREDLFVVSKLASPFHRREHVELAVRKTLADLRLEYLDLYLIHWPVAFEYVPIDLSARGYEDESIDDSADGRKIDTTVSVHETWEAMEELVRNGLVRHIGVSNFPVALLHELLTKAKIPPAVNQCESHPYLQQTKLLEYCKSRNVHFQAYSPLGTSAYKEEGEPAVLDDPILRSIADEHGATAAQVALAWAIQRGTTVVAKSSDPVRQKENIAVVAPDPAVRLTDDDMERIAGLDRNYRYFRPEDWWGELPVAVFD